jgi:hypothetical protein
VRDCAEAASVIIANASNASRSLGMVFPVIERTKKYYQQ